jgi:hypothetical protein
MSVSGIFSIGQVASRIAAQEGCRITARQIARIFEHGFLPEPERLMGNRAIPEEMIPQITEVLRARGTIPNGSELATICPRRARERDGA